MLNKIQLRIKWNWGREYVLEHIRNRIETERSNKRVNRKLKKLPFNFDDENDYFNKHCHYHLIWSRSFDKFSSGWFFILTGIKFFDNIHTDTGCM